MKDEIAVVAGATGAIGSAVVRLLDGRLRVLAIARHVGGIEGETVEAVPGDLASDELVEVLRARADGAVRLVVHAAGAPLGGHVDRTPTKALTAAFEVKVNGFVRLVRGVEERLVSGARLVAVTGNLGYDPLPASVTAGVANAALANLVRQLARSLAPRGVTCHAIAPGPVASPRFDRLVARIAEAEGIEQADARRRLVAGIPLGRIAEPEEVARVVTALLRPEMAHTTGSTIFTDGGRRTAIP